MRNNSILFLTNFRLVNRMVRFNKLVCELLYSFRMIKEPAKYRIIKLIHNVKCIYDVLFSKYKRKKLNILLILQTFLKY